MEQVKELLFLQNHFPKVAVFTCINIKKGQTLIINLRDMDDKQAEKTYNKYLDKYINNMGTMHWRYSEAH